MTRKTRNFVLGAAGILAAGLTTGLVASLGLPVSSRAAGPADLEFVPADAAVVGYANVQEVMASELRQRLRKIEPDTRERDDFEEKTGVDVERDIDTVVGAMLPTAPVAAGDHHGRPLVIARGRFDQVRIEGLARDHGAQIGDYQGVRLLTHADGERPMALGFLEAGVLAVGSAEAVRASIDARRSGRNILSNTEMMRLVNDLDASNAWAVGRFDALANQADLPGGLHDKIPSLSWFSAAGHLNGGVSGTIKAEAKDDEAAANLRDMLRGVVAMVKLQTSDKPAFKTLADSLQLGGEGKTVAVAFAVPAEVFDALEALKEQSGTRRPAER